MIEKLRVFRKMIPFQNHGAWELEEYEALVWAFDKPGISITSGAVLYRQKPCEGYVEGMLICYGIQENGQKVKLPLPLFDDFLVKLDTCWTRADIERAISAEKA